MRRLSKVFYRGSVGLTAKETDELVREATEILQQLGLKEYEARCLVGLISLQSGTAKQLGELTEVPRTRVYDAIRMLEAQGLVEIQHTSPQQYRAVTLSEAMDTLRDRYENRLDRLESSLDRLDVPGPGDESEVQQVWAMTGRVAIENRTNELIRDASDEVVIVIGDPSLISSDLTETLNGLDTDVELLIGALSGDLRSSITDAVPGATTFHSGLDWLHGAEGSLTEPAIGRLMLVDRDTLLVSSIVPGTGEEKAIFGGGFGNGLVVIARRLMSKGLIEERDPVAD
jgi:predicted transcriptional regulator